MTVDVSQLTGVILAGGRGQRMGGQDKGLVEYQGRPLIEYVLARLQPQLPHLMLNINRNQQRYSQYGLPLCRDRWVDFQGPLAGIASAFECSENDYLLFSPCDIPNLPDDLVGRLLETINQQQKSLAVVESPRGLQPLCCLVHRSLKTDLTHYLARGERRVQQWIRQQNPLICRYDSDLPFTNINSLAGCRRA